MKLRRFLSPVLAGFLIAAATHASASIFTLDFGGLGSGEEVLNYYNGGLGSLGAGPGPNYGITFTPNFFAIAAVPPYGPSEVGSFNAASAIMDISSGIPTGIFSFYYEGSNALSSVSLWSGLDGTGVMLADINLTTASGWTADGAVLSGVAKSVVFSGQGKFDQITDAAAVLPEPSSWLLVGTGGAALGAWLRRRAVRAGW
jgi:hypothetical protein